MKKSILLILLSFFSCQLLFSQTHIRLAQVKPAPSSPSTNDSVTIDYTISAASTWKHARSEYVINQDTVIIKTCYYPTVAFTTTYDKRSMGIGKLSEGKYFLKVNLYEGIYPDSCTDSLYDSTVDSFYVSGATVINTPPLNEKVTLYPNPTTGTQTLTLSTANSGQLDIRLYDISGRLLKTIFSGEATPGEKRFEMDLMGLKAGVYFCKLNVDGVTEVRKVIKQ